VARAADEAARAVPGVVDLYGGRLGEFATYGGGERITGVRVQTGPQPSVKLRLVAAYGQALPELTEHVRLRVREAVATFLGRSDVPVDIDVADVVTRDEQPPAAELPATAAQTVGGEPPWQSSTG
jgi:uncharacterized alkaline shock family protein YloU